MEYKIIDNNTAELKFYGTIGMFYQGADDYTNTLKEIEAKGCTNLIVKTHCYGGNVFEGYAMWTANKTSKLNITFQIVGVAASMMAIVMLSGSKVEVSEVAKIMFHAPRSGGGGTSKELFQEANLLKKIEKDFVKIYTNKTGKSEKEAIALMDGTDHWFDADECIALGLANAKISETVFTTNLNGKPDAGTPIDNIYSQYVAVADNSLPNKKNDMDKKAIIAALGLTGVDENSSDTVVLDAITAHNKKQGDAITALSQNQQNAIIAQAEALITAREVEIKATFTKEQKESFVKVATASGIDTLKTVLATMQPVPNLEAFLGGNGSTVSPVAADRKDWDWDRWEKEDPSGLEKLEASNLEAFKKLYQAKFGATTEAVFQ